MFEKTEHQDNVEELMRLAGQDLPANVCVPDENVRLLRAKLIMEEALETIEALGFDVYDVAGDGEVKMHAIGFTARAEGPNLVEIVDGGCDVIVVTTGTLSACGGPNSAFQNAVDQNNLGKFGPGGHRREDGKWIKPPGHNPPDIEGLLAKLREYQAVSGAAAGKHSP